MGMTFDQVADAVRRSSWVCRRCGQSGGNPAADDRAGLPQGGVRGPGPLDATRREPPPPRRRGDARRRLRGGRPAARFGVETAMMVSVFRTGEPGSDRVRGASTEYVQGRADAPARGHVAQGLPGCGGDTEQSALAHAEEELRRVRARVPGADAVFCRAAAGVLESLGVPTSFLGAITLMPALDVPASS